MDVQVVGVALLVGNLALFVVLYGVVSLLKRGRVIKVMWRPSYRAL